MNGIKHGRIKQSLTFWCLNATAWNWDIDRVCVTAKSLGCQSVELVPPELWPTLRQHGLQCALASNGMPDPEWFPSCRSLPPRPQSGRGRSRR